MKTWQHISLLKLKSLFLRLTNVSIRPLLNKHCEFALFLKGTWLNTPLGKICQDELLFVPDRNRQTEMLHNPFIDKGLLQEKNAPKKRFWQEDIPLMSVLSCVFFLPAAASCGDIQHHRQVSILQNLHQPLCLFPWPEEVEVQPVLSGQWWYERAMSDTTVVI